MEIDKIDDLEVVNATIIDIHEQLLKLRLKRHELQIDKGIDELSKKVKALRTERISPSNNHQHHLIYHVKEIRDYAMQFIDFLTPVESEHDDY
jgi:ABC-type phosphate transport system auxiliary subunit